MTGIAGLYKLLFGLLLVGHLTLLLTIVVRKNWRAYPAFSIYVLVNLLQGPLLYGLYRSHGFTSNFSKHFAWGTQAAVLCTRAVAVNEICHQLLARYRGIWALAWRLLLASAVILAFQSLATAGWVWGPAILRADSGLELTIAVVLTLLFAFAKYYGIEADPSLRTLAIGFFLFSYFMAVNNMVLAAHFERYSDLWNVLSGFAYLASVVLWIWALRERQALRRPQITHLSGDLYARLAPDVNSRLRLLNERLSKFFHTEAHGL